MSRGSSEAGKLKVIVLAAIEKDLASSSGVAVSSSTKENVPTIDLSVETNWNFVAAAGTFTKSNATSPHICWKVT